MNISLYTIYDTTINWSDVLFLFFNNLNIYIIFKYIFQTCLDNLTNGSSEVHNLRPGTTVFVPLLDFIVVSVLGSLDGPNGNSRCHKSQYIFLL